MKRLLFLLLSLLTNSFFFEPPIQAQEVISGGVPKFKGEPESMVDWEHISLDTFLSYAKWKERYENYNNVVEQERALREVQHREDVGRIYQCVGTCRIDRGEGFFNGTHRTGIQEGDEIQTVGDSYAWIFLFDGTMVRLSPKSSVTFNELNIGMKENFINARINVGNVLWLSRSESFFEEINIRETDVLFFPPAEYAAMAISEKKNYKEDDLLDLIEEGQTQLRQYQRLNQWVKKNNQMTKGKRTYAFLVMPNGTIMGYSPNVEMVTLMGGKSFVKNRSRETLSLKVGQENKKEINTGISLQLRGFENNELNSLQDDVWITIDDKGRSLTETEDGHWLAVGEFITKRIPTIMMAREIFLRKYSTFAFRQKYNSQLLARNDGYRLWGPLGNEAKASKEKSDLELRLLFLKEYFRRVETSNLLTSSRLKERLIKRGEKIETMEYGRYFFITALNHYYQYEEKSNDKETGEVLNSTKKLLWKKMHGIR